jgi:hypothetical protein
MSQEVSPLPLGFLGHLDAMYTIDLLQTRRGLLIPLQTDMAHGDRRVTTWKASMPSPEGHNDLKCSGLQMYNMATQS